MYPNEINIMSLMGQLERGHTAKLSDHRVDKINELAGDIVKFYEEIFPYDYLNNCEVYESDAESFERFTNDTVKAIENDPETLIQSIIDAVEDDEKYIEQRDSLIVRITSLV